MFDNKLQFNEEYWNQIDTEIPGWMSKAEAEFLVANTLDAPTYVEIGVAYGKSLRMVRHHFPNMGVYGIDKIDHAVQGKVNNVVLYYGDANKLVDKFAENSIDTLFIDGDHTYKGCLSDFVVWYSRVKPGGRIIFHDYNRDKAHIGVTQTVDAVKDLLIDHQVIKYIWCGTKPIL